MTDKSDLLPAQDYALKLLSYRERSRQEIQVRMERKGFQREVIEKVLRYLEGQKYLDDRRFAELWAHDRLRKGYGKVRVILELRKKGVNQEIIDEVVKKTYSSVDEIEMALELVKRKGYNLEWAGDQRVARRASEFLRRRGFSFSVIREVMSRILK
jgi:regulatory protein